MVAGQAMAATYRYRGSGDYMALNWNSNNIVVTSLPGAADTIRANFANNTITLTVAAPLINNFELGVDESGQLTVDTGGILNTSGGQCAVGNNNTNCNGRLTVKTGGVVSVTNLIFVGKGTVGTLTNNGGTVRCTSHLWVGSTATGVGTIYITNGGVFTVGGNIGLGTVNAIAASGGKGSIYVQEGGVLNLTTIDAAGNSIQPNSVLDISGSGVVTKTGNFTAVMSAYTNAGKITAYGGAGMVGIDYNNLNVGKTTLTAIPAGVPPTTNVISIPSIKLVNSTLVISWPDSAGYYGLQSATNLAAPVVWKTVTNTVITSNGTNQVTVNRSAQRTFFRLSPEVDPGTLTGKLMMGYQGWFSAPGDGSAQNSWVHWFGNNTPDAANAHFDFWPDTSELDADELFSTSMTYSNGSPAKLYSAYKQKTVVRHFKWMRENNLDGVFFQRFLSDLGGVNITALRNQVATNVKVGAETYGRVFAIMYDISGYATNTLVSKLTNDWLYLVNTQLVTNSTAYLHHNGKPVVAIWGFGFSGRSDTPQQAQQAIAWFKAAGCTVMGGLPTNWRTLTGDAQTNPAWSNVFRSFDVISPWSVGRYSSNGGADTFKNNYIVPDLADCTSNGIDYLPVIFPGFSWTNLNGGPLNQIPRNGGNFYWRQAYNAVSSGCTMVYGAMFDEVDEGTAMYKCVTTAAGLPAQGTFVPLNIDGYNLGSDWYLRLADQAGKMLRGEIPVTSTIPITPP